MKIEEGKFYRSRDGRKVGPMVPVQCDSYDEEWEWTDAPNGIPETYKRLWINDGRNEEHGESELDLIAEWSEEPPKLWRDMTPEEKGALLLAHHEGKMIETWFRGAWIGKGHGGWGKENAYRIRPEPKRETVRIEGYVISNDDCVFSNMRDILGDTHRITFDLIDGKPDCASVKMERIE
jgi:hypothetical protein